MPSFFLFWSMCSLFASASSSGSLLSLVYLTHLLSFFIPLSVCFPFLFASSPLQVLFSAQRRTFCFRQNFSHVIEFAILLAWSGKASGSSVTLFVEVLVESKLLPRGVFPSAAILSRLGDYIALLDPIICVGSLFHVHSSLHLRVSRFSCVFSSLPSFLV